MDDGGSKGGSSARGTAVLSRMTHFMAMSMEKNTHQLRGI